MSKKRITITVLLVAAISLTMYFLFHSKNETQQAKSDYRYGTEAPAKKEPRILYWVDPMHPSYKSDKPGIAPDCGMQLTPVYAEEEEPSKLLHPERSNSAAASSS